MCSSTTRYSQQIGSLWPDSGYEFPPSSPDHIVPIELNFQEIIESPSMPKIARNVNKVTISIPLRALSDNTLEEHRTHLEAMSWCLSYLGVPEELHSKIIDDTCQWVNFEVAECAKTPPMIVVNVSASTEVLDSGFAGADYPVLPDSMDMEDLGFVCC